MSPPSNNSLVYDIKVTLLRSIYSSVDLCKVILTESEDCGHLQSDFDRDRTFCGPVQSDIERERKFCGPVQSDTDRVRSSRAISLKFAQVRKTIY